MGARRYKVAWKRSIPSCISIKLQDLLTPADHVIVELTESVEFKSLPSGLHHVEEDLMYVSVNDSRRAILSY